MENGHVQIHDPFASSMDDTEEFRLLMAYGKRRRLKKVSEHSLVLEAQMGDLHATGASSRQKPVDNGKKEVKMMKKKKRKGGKALSRMFACIKGEGPARVPDVESRCGGLPDEDAKLKQAAGRLMEIADQIPLTPPDIETDSGDDVEKVIGLLLREAGDKLNEETLKDANIAAELFGNYSFFERVIETLLRRLRLVPEVPQALPRTQIAVTCEVTSRMSALTTLPMSRMLDHGARYLRDHYSSWVKRHGGYENAFYSEDEEDEE